ncbi:hypothetical protein OIU74_012708 [Salix koriyanagi]|uniref:Uncharacterized protein n=1 Tax=Salix koriyanagi TaxID=2511006 RepID=A0A9Q0Q862_9ROSI|nr:hypothetical protein OIU74_012708 [Salix koriyanagi]
MTSIEFYRMKGGKEARFGLFSSILSAKHYTVKNMAADPYQLRRAPTIHHYSNSREDLDSEIASVEFATYTVQIPPTPDNQPMEIPVENEKKLERSCSSNSMFTGGHN